MLQAIAAAYLLKSRSIQDADRFRKTHDLPQLLKGLAALDKESYIKTHNLRCLYAGLEPAILERLTSVKVSDIGTRLREFIEEHRNDFVESLYVFEGQGHRRTMLFSMGCWRL